MENIFQDNAGAILAILLTICLTLFSKIIINVFKMGLLYKSQLVERKEFNEFKNEIKRDLRAYKEELTQVVMTTTMKIVEEKLKDIENVKKTASAMREVEIRMTEQMKLFNDKFVEVSSIGENIRSLNARVEALSEVTGNKNSIIRRTEK